MGRTNGRQVRHLTVDRGDWVDRRALDERGDLIGVIVDVYDDPAAERPAWLAISTGFFGTRIAVAPLGDTTRLGDDVVIGHPRHTITTAPPVDVVVTIGRADQRSLLDHYAAPAPHTSDGSPRSNESST